VREKKYHSNYEQAIRKFSNGIELEDSQPGGNPKKMIQKIQGISKGQDHQ
jgi:hypothetical protein